ncbi:MAG: hypothetical protein ACLTWO_06830 [Blautia massiliensis (ex Durand et al. 2017)]|uniref:hypothetical protein n=1 Tax=uncultured Subdoligranulum sp. TaxID=512298 RepID=UPI00260E9623|nr:hypothetical protein [uncultured Subdoligranulum sp.]
MENLTFKLYSPLTAEFLPDDNRFWQEDELVELSGYELSDYAAAISEQIEREGDHLEQYLDDENSPYLAAHVKSIRISVEERGGELCGCATVVVDEDLTERGWNDLQEYLSGQYSDGWGEGFEQRDIQVEDGNLNVHFWQEERFAFTVEQVANEPQLEQAAVHTPQQTKSSQPAKKYEITDISHPVYPELHRIRALRQVGTDVPAGTLGGYVQSEANLSQDSDDAWLYDDSISRDEANVCGGAQLHDRAVAQDLALVSGSSTMYDNAVACDNAILTAGCIRNDAIVCGNARVRENAATHIAPVVTGQSVVMGDLSGSVVVYGRGFILPGQTVDNPTRRLIGLNERGAAIVRDPGLTPGCDGKNRNTPER